MDHRQLCDYFQNKLGASASYPFGPEVRVYKVGNKMFGIIAEANNPLSINLKCDPDEALALRDVFENVIPGYHMNKVHWNTVIMEGDVPDGEVMRMIDNSYDLIVASLPKKIRNNLTETN
ncbi:MmcQ/YjbR family DNA-binding protein [Aliikangiella marina]|uniref:MmcQ/YjbR family DNA-binding protein n=1 Tax=Aliikangiella marina TaxID=1712262 RepID=A0A545TJR5_9GAMM|nr:MmcQ/YjbR family DNA-binding protein [Aliikangiella marina]TQV77462.1 MmcQ/YjbR family DNA-binding protein [Aliikangiella marina]